jgi:hypothetical protein
VAVLSMSKRECSRLQVLLQVQSCRLRVAGCELIGLHRRQVFRLLRDPKQDGATSSLSKRRGKIHTVQPGSIVDHCRPCWSWSRRSKPPSRRASSEGALRGSDRRTTSRRRVCRPRAGPHATRLPRLRPEAPAWRADPLCIPLHNGNPTRQAGTITPWLGWVSQGSGNLPRSLRRGGSATAEWREPASSDRLPVHPAMPPAPISASFRAGGVYYLAAGGAQARMHAHTSSQTC